jgi:hypothetical protein
MFALESACESVASGGVYLRWSVNMLRIVQPQEYVHLIMDDQCLHGDAGMPSPSTLARRKAKWQNHDHTQFVK